MNLDEIYAKYDKIIREDSSLPYIKCNNCNSTFFYPRHFCPKCGSNNIEVMRSSGIGKVFSWTKIYRKGDKWIYGIVELEEGFKVYCNFTEDIKIGDKVKVKVVPKDDRYYSIIASKI
ncbi:nucleic acid-binding protein [Sulfolobus sp. S-194]|uniref:Zn-ribbon domain-containing OB-fold protein n=1 Tax=Sulfolobus sp. S-194 TaxID=2512240 RepID=UPI001436FD3F|nr:zinc ribbon domain-containing protein [Sulfolobus sp. S-194]QIW23826.1 nucleic acid-binding protein [Sulfolobus sp. S-194]